MSKMKFFDNEKTKYIMRCDSVIKSSTIEYTDCELWFAWYPVKVIHTDNFSTHYSFFEFVKRRISILKIEYESGRKIVNKFKQYRPINWVDPKKEQNDK